MLAVQQSSAIFIALWRCQASGAIQSSPSPTAGLKKVFATIKKHLAQNNHITKNSPVILQTQGCPGAVR